MSLGPEGEWMYLLEAFGIRC